MSSHQLIQNCILATEKNVKAINIFTSLSENQLNWKLDSESWSVAECISHLVNSNALYLKKIEKILNSIQAGKETDFPYRQSIAGKFIAKGIDPENLRKTKTFKVFFPDRSKIDKEILNEYYKSSKNFVELVSKMRMLDLKKIKLSSPVNKLIRLNLGDPLIFIPMHDERHINQAESVIKHKHFPID